VIYVLRKLLADEHDHWVLLLGSNFSDCRASLPQIKFFDRYRAVYADAEETGAAGYNVLGTEKQRL
jgi:hypothetical protein